MKLKLVIISIVALMICANGASGKITTHKNTVAGSYNFLFSTPRVGSETSEAKPDVNADSLQVDSVELLPDENMPLIVFLHGASLCGNDLNRVRRYGTIDAIEKGRDIGAYVLAPQNHGGAWRPEKIMKLVNWAKNNYRIDTTRIYVIGMSLGGYGTLDFAAAYPDKVAAAAAFCGGSTARPERLKMLSDVPLWIVHGTADKAISVKESDKVTGIINQADSSAHCLSYDRVPGMNHSQPARLFYLSEVYNWLMSHATTDMPRKLTSTPELTDSLMRGAYRDLKSTGVKRYKTTPAKTKKKATRKKKTSKKRKRTRRKK